MRTVEMTAKARRKRAGQAEGEALLLGFPNV